MSRAIPDPSNPTNPTNPTNPFCPKPDPHLVVPGWLSRKSQPPSSLLRTSLPLFSFFSLFSFFFWRNSTKTFSLSSLSIGLLLKEAALVDVNRAIKTGFDQISSQKNFSKVPTKHPAMTLFRKSITAVFN